MSERYIVIDNPSGLPTLPLSQIKTFQSDLKVPPTPTQLDKLKRSILEHRLFIAKAIFFEDGQAYTEDGHQTLLALQDLRRQGYTGCEIVSYEMQDGRLQEASRARHDDILIPYVAVVPRGETVEERRKDAAEKLLQINSQYAAINPQTSFFDEMGFSVLDVDDLLSKIDIPDLNIPDLEGFDSYVEKQIIPYKRTHILLSFPPSRLIDIEPHLSAILALPDVDYEQGSN